MTDIKGEAGTEPAIRITNLEKEYILGQIGGGTLQNDLQSWWAKKRGREDPNSRIGSDGRTRGGRLLALSGINLTVGRGEALGIIGRNGAGKSTLLKIISRVTAPTRGKVELFGRVTSMLEVGTGFHGEMTGLENIYMNGSILGMTKSQIRERLDEIIAFSEVGQFIDTPVKRYSSGMYVKLAFSVAAHLESEIMIMDEVLAVGDAAFQQKCLTAMKHAAEKENRTVLYVSHNMQTIRRLCDRCVVLDEGRVVFDGEVEEAIAAYMDSHFSGETEIIYDSLPHADWITFPGLRLRDARFPEKKNNIFDSSKPMTLSLSWKNLRAIEKVSLRVEIRSMTEEPLATYVLYDFYSGDAGQEAALDLELDISSFTEGTYYMFYTFFQHDAAGNNADLECREGLCFEVSPGASEGRLIWDARLWGSLQFDNVRIISLK